jgi:hypothetical protein
MNTPSTAILTTESRFETPSQKASGFSEDQPWQILLYQGLVLVEFAHGTMISPEMFADINRFLNADPTKYRTANLVCDLRNVVPSPETGYKEMMQLAGRFRGMMESWWKHEKTALVVSNELVYGLGRMYGALAEYNSGLKVEIFRNDLRGAIHWACTAPDPALGRHQNGLHLTKLLHNTP